MTDNNAQQKQEDVAAAANSTVFVYDTENDFPPHHEANFKVLEITSAVRRIPYMACYSWDDLETVNLQTNGANLKLIGEMAFCECRYLSLVKMGPNVEYISKNAFQRCSKLQTIEWNEQVQEIGIQAFNSCWGMERLDMSVVTKLLTIQRNCFESCNKLKTAILPPNLKMIEKWAFARCEALREITWSKTLEETGFASFYNCSSLATLDLSAILQLKTIGPSSFACCSSLETVRLPISLKILGRSAFCECTSLTDVQMNDELEEIGICCFETCTALTNVELPPRLESLPGRAFYKCSSLERVGLSDRLVSIGTAAFGECTVLRHMPLPNGLVKDQIGANAFFMCHQLFADTADLDYWRTNGTEETDGDGNYPRDATKLMIQSSIPWFIDSLPFTDCKFESIDMQGCDLKKGIRLKNLFPDTTPRLSMNRLVGMYAKAPMTQAKFQLAAENNQAARRRWGALKEKDLQKLKEIELAFANSIFELVHWCSGIGLLEGNSEGKRESGTLRVDE